MTISRVHLLDEIIQLYVGQVAFYKTVKTILEGKCAYIHRYFFDDLVYSICMYNVYVIS